MSHLPTPHVEVTLDAYGIPVIEAKNYVDGACKGAVKPFEEGYACASMVKRDKPEAAIPCAEGGFLPVGRQTIMGGSL